MKRLYLIRHAKSSWKERVNDHKRPLKTKGKDDACLLSKYTKDLFETPDLVMSSTANRAQSTAKYFLKNWKIDEGKFKLVEALYDFSGSNLIQTIKQSDDNVNSLMIFGHNFAITDFVNTFGNIYIDNVPTCGFVIIDFDTNSWNAINKGKTVYKLFPKEIRNH